MNYIYIYILLFSNNFNNWYVKMNYKINSRLLSAKLNPLITCSLKNHCRFLFESIKEQ